ncbi:MAG: hypothetical protein CMJ83_11015 [Planctomycetes bacterium]|nr:hypothetical protein [Planctomycetota bacterium]
MAADPRSISQHPEPLRVLLLDEQGRPVSAARVSAEARQVSLDDSLQLGDVPGLLAPLVEVTPSDGEVTFGPLADVAYRISVAREGFVGRTGIDGRPGEDLIITLREGRVLRGQIIDSDTATPIPDALVRVSGIDWNHREITRGAASTDANGVFLVEGVGDHGVEIRVSAPWYPTFKVELPAEAPASVLAMSRSPRGVSARILDEHTGEPVEGVRIYALGVEAVTDTEGRFLITGISLPEGAAPAETVMAPLRCEHPAYVTRKLDVPVPGVIPDGEGHAVEVDVIGMEPRSALEGVLVDPDGLPVADGLVVLAPAGSNVAVPGALRQNHTARTGLDGRFQFETIPEFRGPLHLTALVPGYAAALRVIGNEEARVSVRLDYGLDLSLAVPGTSGERMVVLEERGGANIGGQTTIRRRPGHTDRQGRVAFTQVRRGRVRIIVPGGGVMNLDMGPNGASAIHVESQASTG